MSNIYMKILKIQKPPNTGRLLLKDSPQNLIIYN